MSRPTAVEMVSSPSLSTENEKKEAGDIVNSPSGSDAAGIDDVERNNVDSPSAPSNPDVEPEIDGGTRAWLQVVGSFLVFGNIWGLTFAFGVFQSFYERSYLPGESASAISWIGTVAIFLLVFGGVISGPLFDLGYFRTMLLCGALLETLGIFLMSLCDTYWQLFLTQALMMGLGAGLLYIPGLTLVGRSFNKNRALAMSITTCGAPVGGIVYTLMFEQLIDRLGFGSTLRAMGYYMLGTFCISFPLCLWGIRNLGSHGNGTRKLFDRKALTDVPFLLFSFAQLFNFLGYLIPFVYLPTYGQSQLGYSQSFSFLIIIISQAVSIVGRMISGYIANNLGVMLPWSACALVSGILCFGWIGVSGKGGYLTIAILYGGFSGALIPLPPSIFPTVCTDPTVLGTRLGMAQAFSAVGSLLGAPIGGALIGVAGGADKFLGLQIFSGLVLAMGSGCVLWLWILLVRRRNLRKLI